jgi:uncharacterized oxidoreductase
MELSSNTILITGGASGIGLALAERFVKAGSEVIICGRRLSKLREAKSKHPQLHTRVCDVSRESERIGLFNWVTSEFPQVNVLINNAGIQVRTRLAQNADWGKMREELAINLEAPLHLSTMFIPHLQKQKQPAIINITSGLAFVPLALAPVYCATKAALHSFTLSLRRQLASTPITVVEIAPPAVNTDLGGVGLHAKDISVGEFLDAVMTRLAKGELEIGYGFAEKSSHASRAELDEIFNRINQSGW